MPGVGGLSIANNLLSNDIQLNLNKNQQALQDTTSQLSSGLRINSPKDDPSGFSIATNLQTQVDSFDQASRNVQDANNAATVTSGALTTITSILQKIRSLSVQAGSNLLSASDRQNIQTEITQLIAEINNLANNTQFNGLNLLDGSKAGYQPAVNATATLTQNSALNSQNANLISGVSISTSDAALVDGTLQFQVVQTGNTIATQVFYITSGAPSTPGALSGELLTTIANYNTAVNVGFIDGLGTGFSGTDIGTGAEGLMLTLSAVVTSDIGSSTFVKISQYVSSTNYATTTALTVQSEANEGQFVAFNIGAVNASALRVSNLNVFSQSPGYDVLASQDNIGQIDAALNNVLTLQANIGAVEVRLADEQDNDNLASVNLQASESTIRDLNVAQASTNYTKEQLLVNFGTSLLAQANTNAQSVLTLFR
jgi:flagellin